MIMLDELADSSSEMPLAEQHELVQALGPDRQHEALGVSVEVGAVSRKLQALDVCGVEQASKFVGEQRIAIVDHVAHATEETVDSVGEIASNLHHPGAMGLANDARDVDPACLDIDDEQNVIANEPDERENLESPDPV